MSWVGGYESFENEKDWPAEARLTNLAAGKPTALAVWMKAAID